LSRAINKSGEGAWREECLCFDTSRRGCDRKSLWRICDDGANLQGAKTFGEQLAGDKISPRA